MTNNKELLLVHTSMYGVKLQHTVNIMLTPQFYTLKKEVLPVKYAYQAKKIAPSLFEGLLEEGEYEYFTFKEEVDGEEKWVFIAYDAEKITDFLESKGMDMNQVSKVYFAQQSLKHFSRDALVLGRDDALTVIDNTVVVVPRSALGEETFPSLRFTNAFTPEASGVKIESKHEEKSSIVSQTQAWTLAAIFLLFAGMFVVESSRYGGDTQSEQEEIQSIYTQYPYLQSSYTREDAIKKYSTIDKKERRKRAAIKASSGMIFKGVTLTKLKIDEKKFVADFECTDSTVAKRIKNLAKKTKDTFALDALRVKGDTKVVIEGTL